MNNLILYLLQSALSLSLFYVFYWLFLRKDTFFHIIRIYLVFSILFAMLIPLLKFNFINSDTNTTYSVMLEAITINATTLKPAISSNIDIFRILSILYLAGVVIFFLRFIIQVGQLILLIKRNTIFNYQGFKFVEVNRNLTPFSFFHLIFINRGNVNKKAINAIISHEQVHCRQFHSLDVILLEFLTIVQWFNPFVWFYRSSIKTIHEYLADEGVLHKGYNVIAYQNLLLRQSFGLQVNGLANNFNHSLIKKRIIMMTKNKSNFAAKLKLLLITPAAFMLALVFTTSPVVKTFAQVEKAPEPNVMKQKPQDVEEEQIFVVAEDMPQFPGGLKAQAKYMSSKIIYPEEVRKNKKEGRVFVTFVVEKDGSVTNVKLLRGFDKACDEVALNAVKEMPKWIPGKQRGKPVRVQYNVPVRFKLDGDKKVKNESAVPKAPPPPQPPKK